MGPAQLFEGAEMGAAAGRGDAARFTLQLDAQRDERVTLGQHDMGCARCGTTTSG